MIPLSRAKRTKPSALPAAAIALVLIASAGPAFAGKGWRSPVRTASGVVSYAVFNNGSVGINPHDYRSIKREFSVSAYGQGPKAQLAAKRDAIRFGTRLFRKELNKIRPSNAVSYSVQKDGHIGINPHDYRNVAKEFPVNGGSQSRALRKAKSYSYRIFREMLKGLQARPSLTMNGAPLGAAPMPISGA